MVCIYSQVISSQMFANVCKCNVEWYHIHFELKNLKSISIPASKNKGLFRQNCEPKMFGSTMSNGNDNYFEQKTPGQKMLNIFYLRLVQKDPLTKLLDSQMQVKIIPKWRNSHF